MLRLNTRQQIIVGFVLATLLLLTRGSHVPAADMLPSASWAVFFLAGVYLRSFWAPMGLLALAAGSDVAAVLWGGVDPSCFSAAYPFLAPAYGSLWLAGYWYANRYQPNFKTLGPLIVAAVTGTVVCSIISSGSYYLFSGAFETHSVSEFVARIVKYTPSRLGNIAFYVVCAAFIHVVCSRDFDLATAGRRGQQHD